jgi:serine/threonine protein kinase
MSVDEGGFAGPGSRRRPRAGDRIGNYEVLGRLARGGMAELYVAKRVGLEGFQKVVVLKRILPHLAENPEFVEMFLAEARLAATLEHPNIVHVSDIGKDGGDFFFTMAYIHGKDLLAILRRCAMLRQRFPLSHAITVALQICAGLHHAHEQVDWQGRPLGIVHRDISPANVLVTWHGNVKVVDFGIAKAAAQTGVTQVGVRKGKASYMSPEQCRANDVDRRTDIWAIGVVLFEITTMTRLFKADNELAIMHRIVTGDVPMPHAIVPDYPPQLAQIVMRCLELDPARRYPTAQALRRDLETFAHDQRIATSTDGLGEFLRELYPPEAQQLPWTTSTEPEPAARPQPVGLELATRVTGPVSAPSGTSDARLHPVTDPSAVHEPESVTTPGVPMPQARPTTQPAPGRTMPVPVVDPRGWEAGGTTDTEGPGQVTHSGIDVVAVPRRQVAPWVAVAAVAVASAVGGAAWVLWPPLPAPVSEASPSPEPSRDDLNAEQILVLVNQPNPELALDYRRRHDLLERLNGDPDARVNVDTTLQTRLDLLQAADAADPCLTFEEALQALERTAMPTDLGFLTRATSPPSCPDFEPRLQALRERLRATDSPPG